MASNIQTLLTSIAVLAAFCMQTVSADSQTSIVLEAEDMAIKTVGAQMGDGSWNIWSFGYLEDNVVIDTDGSHQIRVRARGRSALNVRAQMSVLIDGKVVDSRAVEEGSFADYDITLALSAGDHRIAVRFDNDYWDPANNIDRNLFVDRLTITESVETPIPLTYGSSGNGSENTQDCELSVAGDIAASIAEASPGSVICVESGDYVDEGIVAVRDSFRTIRARGRVELLGVAIDADNVTLDGFRFTSGDTKTIREAAILLKGRQFVIENNYIVNQAVQTGIKCDSRINCRDATIRFNTIAGIENYGIIITGADHTVERNNVFGLKRSVAGSDVDALRFFGTGHRIRENYFHDINEFQSERDPDGDTPHVDCFQTFTTFESYSPNRNPIETTDVIIENNYCVRISRQCAIFENNRLDDRITHGIVFRNNVCETYDSQVINIKGVDNVDIHNNHIGGNSRYHIINVQPSGSDGRRPAKNISIRNNILQRESERVNVLTNRGENVTMEANLVLTQATTITRSRNFQRNVNARYAATEETDFVEFRQLSASEPTRDKGIWVADPGKLDLAGQPRNADGAIDIGPYEH